MTPTKTRAPHTSCYPAAGVTRSLIRRVYLLERRSRARRATVQDAEPGRLVLDGESAQAVMAWHREHGDPAQIGDGDGLATVHIAQEARR